MPPSCTVTEASVEASASVRFTWEFEANLDFAPGDVFKSQPQYSAPLDGEWFFRIRGLSQEPSTISFELEHGPLERGSLGDRVDVTMDLEWLDTAEGSAVPLWSFTLAPSSQPSGTSEGTSYGFGSVLELDPPEECPLDLYRSTRRFRFSISIDKDLEATPAGTHGTPFHDQSKALRLTGERLARGASADNSTLIRRFSYSKLPP